MLIDWFTVVAQALNFLILVFLLSHFLYKPILAAIDSREKKIAAKLADANAKKAEAHKERDEFEQKNAQFDQERAALLTRARDEAKGEHQRLLEEGRKAADAMAAKRQEALQSEARNLAQAIAQRTQHEVFAIARKALEDLASTGLEAQITDVFNRRLRAMDESAKSKLGEALKAGPEPRVIKSAFDLPEAQRASIQKALNETFSADIHLRFETAPDVVGGIELSAGGQRVAWSIAGYLGSLGKGVSELLKSEEEAASTRVEPKPAQKTAPEAKEDPRPGATPVDSPGGKPEPKPEIKVEPKADPGAPPKSEPTPVPKAGAAPDAATVEPR